MSQAGVFQEYLPEDISKVDVFYVLSRLTDIASNEREYLLFEVSDAERKFSRVPLYQLPSVSLIIEASGRHSLYGKSRPTTHGEMLMYLTGLSRRDLERLPTVRKVCVELLGNDLEVFYLEVGEDISSIRAPAWCRAMIWKSYHEASLVLPGVSQMILGKLKTLPESISMKESIALTGVIASVTYSTFMH